MRHLFHLNKYFVKYKYRFIFGILFVSLSNFFGVIYPQVVRHAFDLVGQNITYYRLFDGTVLQQSFYSIFSRGLMLFGLFVFLLALTKGFFLFLSRQTIIVMSRLIEYDLKNEIYEHYQRLDLAFYKRNNTGDLMSRITEDVSKVRMYLGPALMYSVNLVVLFIVVISAMISVNAELTAYVLIPLPLLSITIYYISNLINIKSEEIQKKLGFITSIAQEVYSGIRVVKAYVQEKHMADYFGRESKGYKDASIDLARVEAFFYPTMLVLIGLSTILTIFVGGLGVFKGKVTAGNIAEFVIYINMLTWPVTAIGWIASIVQRASASQKRINDILQVKPAIRSKKSLRHHIQGEIQFQNVTFTYPDTGIKALDRFELHLHAGEKLAILGRTGSGKSTLAELMMRMYDPQEGIIKIDGIDIKDFEPGNLRRQIGYVPQDVFLFSDTIEHNIAFGNYHASREEIERAAQLACIDKEINQLPARYKTIIGERGVTLSGGQKQRISIARAILQNPNVFLFDDCLSAVDARTEQRILENLYKLWKDKTVIVITHRIFHLMEFDKIIVMKHGKIAEEGTHESLLAKKGLYFELLELQKMEESVKE